MEGETIRSKIADFIARGAIQISRKYRTIAVPPVLPQGKTFLDVLRESNPQYWQRLEDQARQHLVHQNRETWIELTFEEFNQWLVQRGCKPLALPPEPYETWEEYWAENDKHPKGVRRLEAT